MTWRAVVRGLITLLLATAPAVPVRSRDAAGNLINASRFGAVTAVSPARQVQLMARFHF